MGELQVLGRFLLVIGILLAVLGLILVLVGRVPYLGRLPGDIIYQRGNFTLYIPLMTMLLLSLLLTLILNLVFRR